ncbi:macrolide ABC transporter ATP-binding protein [Candidatus Dependentiae bacterium HGW-Dependentiae-1]|nr:MAG: macrolide ABC transporter ATP-binding protein [Candidatus Dependentiae bacterium HGW-Dependentiae-1]
MALLQARKLTKTFMLPGRELTVLHDISFSIEKGEFLSITGQSGSGKSTLMHIIGCLDVPTTGSYFIEGQDISHLSPDELAHIRNKKIGFVFQQFNLLPDLTALENVALPQLYAGISEKEAYAKAEKLLCSVALDCRLDHHPQRMSGGEQQRVAIARALINDPAIILADEPTGNLDSKTGHMVMDMFFKLNQEAGITIIIVTHDMELAKQTRRIIKLLDGKIEQDQKTT